MKTIGIIGTAKNTGKTTTLSHLINLNKSSKIAVTGIGYDGEEIDNITNLPKPRLFFEKSALVATSEKCLKYTNVKYKILEKTEIETSLGLVYLIEVSEPGMIVIAGPNKTSQLNILIEKFRNYNLDYLFIDGSLNRIAPMYLVDELIFTTGGSRNTDIDILVSEMKAIENIFSFPKTNVSLSNLLKITLISENSVKETSLTSLYDSEDQKHLLDEITNKTTGIIFPSFFSAERLISLRKNIQLKINSNPKIILFSPIHLILSTDFENLKFVIEKIINTNNHIEYIFKPKLSAITVNPFYPKMNNYSFIPSYLNKDELLTKMRSNLKTRVCNVFEENIF